MLLYLLASLPFAGIIMYYLFFSPSSQVFGRVVYKFEPHGKEVALTFDDGPNEPYTSELLEVLKKHDVKATFFTCGACILRHQETLKKVYSDGHVIGNHSHGHVFTHYLRPKSYTAEVSATNELIESTIGVKPSLYRSPWLFRTPLLLRSIKRLGLTPIWGIFGSEIEVFQPKPKRMYKRALKLSKPGTILIFHDGKESKGGDRRNTVLAVDMLIAELKRCNYTFVTINKDILGRI